MHHRTPAVRHPLFVLLLLAGTTAIVLAGGALAQTRAATDPPPLRTQGVFAAVEIVTVEGETLRLDTRTGVMHALDGDISYTGTSSRWRVRVAPVPERTSGFLSLDSREVQGRPVHILIDEVTGETWLLRYRQRDRGTWTRVSVQVP